VNYKSVDKFGRTPLHYTAISNHYDLAEMLLSEGDVDPNMLDKQGYTPLTLCFCGNKCKRPHYWIHGKEFL